MAQQQDIEEPIRHSEMMKRNNVFSSKNRMVVGHGSDSLKNTPLLRVLQRGNFDDAAHVLLQGLKSTIEPKRVSVSSSSIKTVMDVLFCWANLDTDYVWRSKTPNKEKLSLANSSTRARVYTRHRREYLSFLHTSIEVMMRLTFLRSAQYSQNLSIFNSCFRGKNPTHCNGCFIFPLVKQSLSLQQRQVPYCAYCTNHPTLVLETRKETRQSLLTHPFLVVLCLASSADTLCCPSSSVTRRILFTVLESNLLVPYWRIQTLCLKFFFDIVASLRVSFP